MNENEKLLTQAVLELRDRNNRLTFMVFELCKINDLKLPSIDGDYLNRYEEWIKKYDKSVAAEEE